MIAASLDMVAGITLDMGQTDLTMGDVATSTDQRVYTTDGQRRRTDNFSAPASRNVSLRYNVSYQAEDSDEAEELRPTYSFRSSVLSDRRDNQLSRRLDWALQARSVQMSAMLDALVITGRKRPCSNA